MRKICSTPSSIHFRRLNCPKTTLLPRSDCRVGLHLSMPKLPTHSPNQVRDQNLFPPSPLAGEGPGVREARTASPYPKHSNPEYRNASQQHLPLQKTHTHTFPPSPLAG